MIQALVLIGVGIFLVLSLLHFYWVFGGTWGLESAIPEKFAETFFDEKNKSKNRIATLIVALGLLLFALIIGSNYFSITHLISKEWAAIGSRIIGAIFIIRAIGDFNIVGIFKKKSDSKFAKSDNKIYIPLCLFLGCLSIGITLLT